MLSRLARPKKVNAFTEKFIKVNRKHDKLSVHWGDFGALERYFDTTTWNDLKWMARRIAEINPEDIRLALSDSGLPDPVVELYHIKLLKRRNEMVKAFELENEYDLIETPELKNFPPKGSKYEGVIEKGKLVKKSFEGKNDLYIVQEKWSTFLPKLLSFDIPISSWTDKSSGEEFSSSLKGLNELSASLGASDFSSPTAITAIPVGIGVQAILSRTVEPNEQMLNSNGQMRIYKVVDSLKFRFGLDSPLLHKVMKSLKVVGAAASVKFSTRVFQSNHIRFPTRRL